MTSSSSALQVSLSSTLSTSPFTSSLDTLIPSTGTGLGLDNSLYALSHEITDEDREPTGQVCPLLSHVCMYVCMQDDTQVHVHDV